MATRKQIAAAKRNLKKARAASKKKANRRKGSKKVKSRKGTIPNALLEKRVKRLNTIAKSRGLAHFRGDAKK